MTLDKIRWLWSETGRYRTLFNDLTRGDVNNFYTVMTLPDSFWLDILDDQDHLVGMIYWTDLAQMIDANAHMMFFDRKPAEKVELCKAVAKWFFSYFPQCNRMTATLPEIYHVTIRLTRKIGFIEEGRKRKSQLMGGRFIDEVILGLLASEIR